MSSSLWSIWNTAAKLGLAWPSAAEWTLLALLAASLLTLRAFRETYLKIWMVGWMTLLISRLAEHCFAAKIPPPFDLVVVQATFVLAGNTFRVTLPVVSPSFSSPTEIIPNAELQARLQDNRDL